MFFVPSTAVFLVTIDGTLPYAAFGAVRARFPGSTAAGLSWVLNAYAVVPFDGRPAVKGRGLHRVSWNSLREQ